MKKLELSHLMLILVILPLSLSASRFVPFFAIGGLIISGQYPSPWDRLPPLKRLLTPVGLAVLITVLFWGSSSARSFKPWITLRALPETALFPEKASKFLIDNVKGGNIFNSRNCGSYFLWRLFPAFKTFLDTRGLDAQVISDYNSILFAQRFDNDQNSYMASLNDLIDNDPIKKGADPVEKSFKAEKWDQLLKKYDIDIIAHEASNFFSGVIFPLTFKMIKNDQWKLVYFDGKVFIFVRDIPRFKALIEEHGLGKEKIYDEIGMENARQIGKSNHASIYSSVAFALLMKDGAKESVDQLMKHANDLDQNDLQTSVIEAFIAVKRQKR
jgi:hypothetical protein